MVHRRDPEWHTSEIDGEEVPGLDGAAGEFFRGLRDSGSVESRTPRTVYAVKQPIYVREGAASIVALPGAGKLTIEYHLDYPHHLGEGDASGKRSLQEVRRLPAPAQQPSDAVLP